MSQSNTTSNVYSSGAGTRRPSNAASLGTQRATSDVEEKEERALELQIRLVSGDKFTIHANIEDLVWDVKQKVRGRSDRSNTAALSTSIYTCY